MQRSEKMDIRITERAAAELDNMDSKSFRIVMEGYG